MASAGEKGKSDLSLPDWVAKSLECPVCLETIKDPPIFQCEKGHGLCQTCREPLKAQDKPCPVCHGKLLDVRNLAVENILEQLPNIKCKNEGCTFERSNGELVKRHEEVECRERPAKCEECQEPIAVPKLYEHLQTKHGRPSLEYQNLGTAKFFLTNKHSFTTYSQHPLGKVHNIPEFILNWKSYDSNTTMFWISLCGTAKEAKEYEYTMLIESSAERKAGRRSKVLLMGRGECLSCEVSHEDVKKKPTEVLIFSQGMLQKAAEGNDENKLEWRLAIQKK